jgi:hypothetical protein
MLSSSEVAEVAETATTSTTKLVAVEAEEPLFLVGFLLLLRALLVLVGLALQEQPLQLTAGLPHTEVFMLKVEPQVARLPLQHLL